MPGKKYSEKDIRYLRENKHKSHAELALALGRDKESITQKLFHLRKSDANAESVESKLDNINSMVADIHSKICVSTKEDINKVDPATYSHNPLGKIPHNPRQAVTKVQH